MAQFYAEVQGNRGSTHRLGTKRSGIDAKINGWKTGISVHGFVNKNGEDCFIVSKTGGSNGDQPLTHIVSVVGDNVISGEISWDIKKEYYKGINYIPSVVILDRKEEPPKSRSISGYGSKVPTQYMIKIYSHFCWNWKHGYMPTRFPWNANRQWRRVYAACWSNVASHYVIIKKKKWFLHDYDLTGEINFLGLSKNKQS